MSDQQKSIEVTPKQLEEMKHALGLGYKKRPYRNRYYTSVHCPNWNDLVNKGLATKGGGWTNDQCYYYLTFEGAKLAFGKPLSKKKYEDL